MKGLDGIQGPMYVGTGCVFNRQALYGYGPPSMPRLRKGKESSSCFSCCCPTKKKPAQDPAEVYKDAKREDLNAAIFNLTEIDSKFKFCKIVGLDDWLTEFWIAKLCWGFFSCRLWWVWEVNADLPVELWENFWLIFCLHWVYTNGEWRSTWVCQFINTHQGSYSCYRLWLWREDWMGKRG